VPRRDIHAHEVVKQLDAQGFCNRRWARSNPLEMLIVSHDDANIPDWVHDLESFRRWAKSDDCPTRGWYGYLDGKIWVDPSKEMAGHNLLKAEFAVVLMRLAEEAVAGNFFGPRMHLTNLDVQLCTEPDGMFFSGAALKDKRVRLEDGDDSMEIMGSPEVVLEVLSPTSLQKDTLILRDLYWRAGIQEYWLADPHGNDPAFDILRRGPQGYAAVRKQAGWVKSSVFGKSLRLTRRNDDFGVPIYELEVR
jgi:Uma2 family endonuclease